MSGVPLELGDPIAQYCVVEWSGSLLLLHGLSSNPVGRSGQLCSGSIFKAKYFIRSESSNSPYLNYLFNYSVANYLLITSYAPYIGTAVMQPGGYGRILNSRCLGCIEDGFSAFPYCSNYSVGARQQKAFGRAWLLSDSAGEALRASEELVWLVGAFFPQCFVRRM